MKKIINLAFVASILLWANTADAMLRPLGGAFGKELGNGAKSVSLKLKGASYFQGQPSMYPGNPTTRGEHKANSEAVKL